MESDLRIFCQVLLARLPVLAIDTHYDTKWTLTQEQTQSMVEGLDSKK